MPLALGQKLPELLDIEPEFILAIQAHNLPLGQQQISRQGLIQHRQGPPQVGSGPALVILRPKEIRQGATAMVSPGNGQIDQKRHRFTAGNFYGYTVTLEAGWAK